MPIEEIKVTVPPCEACNAHDSLEEKVDRSIKKNDEDHFSIMNRLDSSLMDLKWMKIISKTILGTILGYFITLGYFIFSNDWATSADLKELKQCIEKGDELHYRNEGRLYKLEEKVKIIKEQK